MLIHKRKRDSWLLVWRELGGNVTFKWRVKNKFTELESGEGGVASGYVYIISEAKRKGGVGKNEIYNQEWFDH